MIRIVFIPKSKVPEQCLEQVETQISLAVEGLYFNEENESRFIWTEQKDDTNLDFEVIIEIPSKLRDELYDFDESNETLVRVIKEINDYLKKFAKWRNRSQMWMISTKIISFQRPTVHRILRVG